MHTEDRIMDEMKDDHLIFMTKLQPGRCLTPARQYARLLQDRSMMAMTAGCLGDARWFAERAHSFNCRVFGIGAKQSCDSLKVLQAVARYQGTLLSAVSG